MNQWWYHNATRTTADHLEGRGRRAKRSVPAAASPEETAGGVDSHRPLPLRVQRRKKRRVLFKATLEPCWLQKRIFYFNAPNSPEAAKNKKKKKRLILEYFALT